MATWHGITDANKHALPGEWAHQMMLHCVHAAWGDGAGGGQGGLWLCGRAALLCTPSSSQGAGRHRHAPNLAGRPKGPRAVAHVAAGARKQPFPAAHMHAAGHEPQPLRHHGATRDRGGVEGWGGVGCLRVGGRACQIRAMVVVVGVPAGSGAFCWATHPTPCQPDPTSAPARPPATLHYTHPPAHPCTHGRPTSGPSTTL